MIKETIDRLERFPVGAIATTVGAATLANAFLLLNFTYLRNIFMIIGIVVFILATIKIFRHKEAFLAEYSNTIPASLYGTYSMLAMIIGAFLLPYSAFLGKNLWLFGVFFHAFAICIFTYRNVIKNFKIDTFVPSWFVTYNGIMVSIVVGGAMNEPTISKYVLIYGISVFFIIIPFMIRRLIIKPLPDMVYHTKAILLAPSSLCSIGYLNVVKEPNLYFAFFLYAIVFVTLISILLSIPKFFSFDFHPGFAGTTFPMAVGTVASFRFSAYLASINLLEYSNIIRNIAGIQLYVTTGIIIFVFYNFLKKIKPTV
ncbi:TDT family transporter [Candidatus Cetobacterium colombiensis]|uniref:TDT family transporter n=1 Tax=Candidatus Cetobacterium colombiensis TaxID=3073100 RepID=A0ABU4W9Y7_9FUSO|nr:TDT family transporter [Candidatus Cetobacterium colombiensis]MDX8336019.1 TDT family transporter [Candidatus Cetobacterium colombiensis]